MKLKSVLIIFLILGFFMAVTAVRPAAAFDAEVSIISEFNEATKTLKSTRDGDVMPMTDPNDDYFDNKAVVSKVNNKKLHIDVSGYGGTIMQYGSVVLNFYTGANAWPEAEGMTEPDDLILKLQYIAPLSNASKVGCDVMVPGITDTPHWIKVIVKDGNGESPVYTWLKFKPAGDLPTVSYTPGIEAGSLWGDNSADLTFHKSLYLTVDADVSTDRVYSWLVDSQGNKIAQSDELSNSAALLIDAANMSDPNFVIRYSDARSEGTKKVAGWNGEFKQVKVEHAKYETSLTGDLNPLTNYDSISDSYTILVPVYENLDTAALNNAEVYYDGKQITNGGASAGGKPAYDPDDENDWITVAVSDAELTGDDSAEKWSFSNSKVAIVFDKTEDIGGSIETITHVAGVDDGVGPRLLRAYVRYDEDNKLILKFSEDLDASKISTSAVKYDIYLSSDDFIDSIALNPDDASELVLTANSTITTTNEIVNIYDATDDDEEMSLKDAMGNPAYALDTDGDGDIETDDGISIAVERVIEEVKITSIDRDDLANVGSTTMVIVFDKSMYLDGDDDVEKEEFYSIEYVPGLEEKDDNPGVAEIEVIDLSTDNVTVTIKLRGVIESTAAEDLPKISIVKNNAGDDMVGGDPAAPVRDSDKAERAPVDEVGPYLKSASFNYNPENGKDIDTLIADNKVTLSLIFSEEVINPGSLGEYTFESDGDWDNLCLRRSINSECEQDPNGDWKVVLTLDGIEAKGKILPFAGPAFNQTPEMTIDFEDIEYVQDAEYNSASDSDHPVAILDATPLWVGEANTADTVNVGNGIVDKINVTFGKNIYIITSRFQRDDDVIKINGDPNIITNVTSGANSIAITLSEKNRKVDTAWTPTVSFDLNDDTIIQDNTSSDMDIVEDFSLSAVDGVAPILVNFNDATTDTIGVYKHDVEVGSSSTTYWWIVKLEFSEEMDPNIWKNPRYASRYIKTGGADNVVMETFLTNDSTPPGTSSMSCGGDTIAVLLRTKTDVTSDSDSRIKLLPAPPHYVLDDLSANYAVGTLELTLRDAGLPPNIWSIPNELVDDIVPTMKSMRIYGTITDDPNNTSVTIGEVYAMHRDDLFVIDENAAGDPNDGAFYIDVTKALGATSIQPDGTYFLKAFGKESVGSQRGFEYGDPIILVVKDENDGDKLKIATAASLANPAYSVAFDGGPTKLPVEHNIKLAEREVITLQTGWNLISTSLNLSYVDSSLCALSGLNPADFTNYMYAPTDILAAEEGSMPDEMLELNDISSVLFTLSHSFFTGNIFYDPATNPIFPVEDELADRFNKTPVFCTGRGYYIYIAPVGLPLTPALGDGDTRLPADWKIVLFGKKVPGPEYKLKVASTTNLIGHWGCLFYNTYDGITAFDSVKGYLPTTVDTTDENETQVYVDDIAGTGSDVVAINVCDIDRAAVDVDVVSTFWSYPGLNNAIWYADLPGFSDMNFVAPGVGYWILIDADAEDGPFFVSYLPKPEDD